MGSFYDIAFPNTVWNYEGETQVRCPFPHHTINGDIYYEQNPSSGVNYEKGLFNCFSCGTGLTEITFIAKYMNLSYSQASQFKSILDKSNEDINDWELAHKALLDNHELMSKLTGELHIPIQTIAQLKLGYEGNGIAFPVFLFGKLINVNTYHKGESPKWTQREGCPTKLIMPYDLWKVDNRSTLICAGEKDMAVARSFNFNAITITGGEGKLPNLFKNDFENRTVYIIYDNDATGIEGALKVAEFLKPVVKKLKIINLSQTCTEKGEDLWDYFHKYHKTKTDLTELIKATPWFSEEDYQREKEKRCPTLSLIEGTSPKYVGRIVRSNVQIIATFETQFYLPSSITATKSGLTEKESENTMVLNDTRSWHLDDYNIKDMMYLIDSNLKEEKIYQYKRDLLNIPKKESKVTIKDISKEIVFKCTVTDYFESTDSKIQRTEYIAYSLNRKLENGQKCRITYKLVPHPFDGQKLIMIILDVEDTNDSVSNFILNNEKINLLKQFQVETTLDQKIDKLVESVKGFIGENRSNLLIKLIDFWYHTPLKFNLGTITDIRGYLETLIVSESRFGKSTTVEAMRQQYGLGTVVNLGGTAATIAGLIGGTNKVNGTYQTRAGLIPQNHEGALIFEELGRCRNEVMQQLTDVRSSNEIRITRVDGELRLPAFVRMLSLSNAKEVNGHTRPISSYPNGISVVTDLIESAADIARFDIIAVLADPSATVIDPFYKPQEPLSQEAYRTRIRWIWSRKPNQIEISQEVYTHTINLANQINKVYDSHIKLFGTEAWKKIIRLAIAIAGYVVSTNETFEKIIVTKDHVNYATNFLISLYDNDTFRFKQFVEEESKLRNISREEVPILQQLYEKNPTLLLHLESISETTRNNMSAIAGVGNEEFSRFVNELVSYSFIRFSGYSIVPTERFRKGMMLVNRNIQVKANGTGFTLEL